MEVSQWALAKMLLIALFLGTALGLLNDGFRMTRLWMGAQLPPVAERLEEKLALPSPLKREMPFLTRGFRRPGRIACVCVTFLEDILLCVSGGVALILLLYATNNGQFRLSAAFAMGLGFGLYRITLSRVVMLCSGTVAALLKSAVRWIVALILFLPVRLSHRLVQLFHPRWQKYRENRRQRVTAKQEARIARITARRFRNGESCMGSRFGMKKGRMKAKQGVAAQSPTAVIKTRGTPVFSSGRFRS